MIDLADEDDDDTYVCHVCIGELLLKKEIKQQGEVHSCNFCDRRRIRCVSIDWLAERINPIYQSLVGTAEEEPYVTDNDNVHWVPRGDCPSAIVTELIEPSDDTISQSLIEKMSEDTAWDVFEGGFDLYDETSDIYSINLPEDPRFRDAWEAFCQSLKHKRRFFSADAKRLLDEILGPILKGGRSQFGGAIRTIGPNHSERFIYRGRQANSDAERLAIYSSPIKQLSAPPPQVAGGGRMNAPGISVFYGSSESETCVAELRVPVGGSAIIGKFEIIRPLRLLDLKWLEQARNSLSYFHPDFLRDHGYSEFIRGFHNEIKKAVIPGRETLEYLPTQVVAEYLWTRTRRVDGLIFGSSQVSGDSTNIVLFPHACLVENADAEPARNVTQAHAGGSEEDPTEHVSYLPEEGAEGSKSPSSSPFDDEQFFASFFPDEEPTPPAVPSLRFLPDDLERRIVQSISFSTTAAPVRYWADRFSDELLGDF